MTNTHTSLGSQSSNLETHGKLTTVPIDTCSIEQYMPSAGFSTMNTCSVILTPVLFKIITTKCDGSRRMENKIQVVPVRRKFTTGPKK